MTEEVTPTIATVVYPVAAPPAEVKPVSNVSIITPKVSLAATMAKINKDKSVGGIAVPDYIKEECEQAEGLDMMGDMIVPNRLKVVQALSNDMKEAGYSEGDVVVTPINVKVGDEANAIDCVVLLSWAEYLLINPRGASDLYWLRDRSTDPRSEIAVKARNRVKAPLPEGGTDKKTGQPFQMEYVKASNFLIWLVDHNVAAIATFMKGEGKYGDAFASLVTSRGLAIYGGLYRLTCNTRTNKGGDKWKGLTAGNSSQNQGFCPHGLIEPMKELHRYYKEQWANQNISVNYDDMTDPQTEGPKVDTSEY